MNNSAKYFFNRCTELLHRKAFDTYRVSLHNPFTIFWELGKSLGRFHKRRIKLFEPTITSISEEAKNQIDNECIDSVFKFGSFSKSQAKGILESKDIKKIRSVTLLCNTLLIENKDFKTNLFSKLKELILEDKDVSYSQIDIYASWLVSQLIFLGYSRKFIVDYLRKSRNYIDKGNSLEDGLGKLEQVFSYGPEKYDVIYKIKCYSESDIKIASQLIRKMEKFPSAYSKNKFVNEKFKEKGEGEGYYSVQIESLDFWSALHKSQPIISETIELNILHDIDNRIVLEKQALIIHSKTKKIRMASTEENLDGFYTYQEPEFYRFVENYKKIEEGSDAREKIRSAIRFYKLGNDSVELEHKFLNYWIGFEQLFSSVDSDEDSIKRIKSFFIPINAVFYWQRRTNYLLASLGRAGKILTVKDLLSDDLDIEGLSDPLILSRLKSYNSILKENKQLKATLEIHSKRLEQHLTRIYRVRNELVHEGKSSVDLFLLTGHLRHYLLFSIEQITNELIDNPPLRNLDDVFVYYENLLVRIKSCMNINEIFELKKYKGYME